MKIEKCRETGKCNPQSGKIEIKTKQPERTNCLWEGLDL